VTDKNQVEELAQQVLKDLGRVDILVNNAGMKPIPHMEATEVVVDAINVNLLSHFWVSN
jgi:NAD(P)-dependent dehydrogenase (short-subunit alcohol dehydrogenase family)